MAFRFSGTSYLYAAGGVLAGAGGYAVWGIPGALIGVAGFLVVCLILLMRHLPNV